MSNPAKMHRSKNFSLIMQLFLTGFIYLFICLCIGHNFYYCWCVILSVGLSYSFLDLSN